MKKNDTNFIKTFTVVLNIVGIVCLIYFAIPFVTHDMSIPFPPKMLGWYSWDTCGFVLTLGLTPLIVANIMAYTYINLKNKFLKALYFLPSLICLVLVCSYLFMSFGNEEKTYESEFISSMKCGLNGKVYYYKVYKELDGTYSLSMDDNDNIPQSAIDYESPEKIFESIENYYKDNGGMCP